jgi:hypothetical protein
MKYQGSCHCKAVRYEVETDLATVLECNCSHCYMKGFLLNFVPAASFTLLTPEARLTEYFFNKRHISHQFCPLCGVESFAHGKDKEGNEMYGINVRCLEGVERESLTITPVNGKDF